MEFGTFIGDGRLSLRVRTSGWSWLCSFQVSVLELSERLARNVSEGYHSSFLISSEAGNTSLIVMVFVSSNAALVMSLNTEPGVYKPCVARL
jgi:hypothetical protein